MQTEIDIASMPVDHLVRHAFLLRVESDDEACVHNHSRAVNLVYAADETSPCVLLLLRCCQYADKNPDKIFAFLMRPRSWSSSARLIDASVPKAIG